MPQLEEFVEEENIYSEEFRERMLEDDEISPSEAAFMEGWDATA